MIQATETTTCDRCGKRGQVPVGSRAHGRMVFCSRKCEGDHLYERRQRQRMNDFDAQQRRYGEIRETPMHILYPEMLEVMECLQAQRPSARKAEDKAR